MFPLQPYRMRTPSDKDTRFLNIVSINYDYVPAGSLFSPKQLWVDLRDPPPPNLRIGSSVRIHLKPNIGIMTNNSPTDVKNSLFKINDIVGSRVVLLPFEGSLWNPHTEGKHYSKGYYGWGHDLRGSCVRPQRSRPKYGYGISQSYLEYHPQYYSH